MNPELLQHPNLPKPMHGLNPRTIKGKAWWDETRYAVQAEQDYKCAACGVHKKDAWPNRWLECHEDYRIDYAAGIMEIDKFVCLCPACHKFIHSGRLFAVDDITKTEKARIVDHGWKVLSEAKLYVSAATFKLIDSGFLPEPEGFIYPELAHANGYKFGPDWFVDRIAEWKKWRMILDGKTYQPKFRSQKEWEKHYGK